MDINGSVITSTIVTVLLFIVWCSVLSGVAFILNYLTGGYLRILWLLGGMILSAISFIALKWVWYATFKMSALSRLRGRIHPPDPRGIWTWWPVIPALWAFSMSYFQTNELYLDESNMPPEYVVIIHALIVFLTGVALLAFKKNKFFVITATLGVLANLFWLIFEAQRITR